MGIFSQFIGKVKEVVRGPLRKVAGKATKGLLERLARIAVKHTPLNRLPKEELAALSATLQVTLPEWGADLAERGTDSLVDIAGDRVDRALTRYNTK